MPIKVAPTTPNVVELAEVVSLSTTPPTSLDLSPRTLYVEDYEDEVESIALLPTNSNRVIEANPDYVLPLTEDSKHPPEGGIAENPPVVENTPDELPIMETIRRAYANNPVLQNAIEELKDSRIPALLKN